MGLASIIVGVVISVLQLVLLVAAGFAMAKLGPLDKIGEYKFVQGSYYLFIPLFCLIEISKATDVSTVANLGLLLLNFIINVLIVSGITLLYCCITKMDIRSTKVFIILTSLGNLAFFPSVIINSLCDHNGLLDGDKNCGISYGLCVFGLFMLNTVAWGAGPFIIKSDRCIALNIRRQMYLIKRLYDSPQNFLADKDFSLLKNQQQVKFANIMNEENQKRDEKKEEKKDENCIQRKLVTEIGLTNINIEKSDKAIAVDYKILEIPELILFSNLLYMGRDVNKQFQEHFNNFLKTVNPKVLSEISKNLPGLCQPPRAKFKEIMKNLIIPPVICCLAAVIIGLISPLKNAIFSDWGNQIAVKTLSYIGAMSTPISNMTLGSKLAAGFIFTKELNLRFKDLVALLVIRFVIAPLAGLGYIILVQRLNIPQINENRILMLILYMYWLVPPSVVLISVFIICNYYTRELALLQFWANIFTVISTPVFIIVYFTIFPPS